MDNISTVGIIDSNQYMVENTQKSEMSSVAFDDVYNEQTQENSLEAIFNRVSAQTGVDVNLLKAVAQAESGFDTEAVSYCGAMGIMQLMPSTAESLGVTDPFDAEQNIRGGAEMLAYLLDDYNGNVNLALAAYNAGSGNVAKYGGVPPFSETLGYINKINDILGGALSGDSTTVADRQTNINAVSYENNNRSSLLSFEDYMYFLETYEKLMEKLFSTISEDEDVSSNSYVKSAYLSQTSKYNSLAEKLMKM